MKNPEEELVGYCVCCKKPIQRKELGGVTAVYYEPVGVVHTSHHGVEAWYDDLYDKIFEETFQER